MSRNEGDRSREQPDGEQAETALLIIDMLTDFEFEDGEQVFENALPAAVKIAELKERVVAKGFPVIYINDNYGKWQEDMHQQIERIEKSSEKGREILKHI